MQIRLDRIDIRDFKRIEALSIELKPVTALVGGNTSGKSSALQATQLGVSILQAAFRGRHSNGRSLGFSATVSNDSVLFRPTEHLLDLKRGGGATQSSGFSITYSGMDTVAGEVVETTISIRRGKNANIAITISGNQEFAAVLADGDKPFSILTPGISGLPIREEWRTKGAIDAAVMHGDANLYLRTVLDHLFMRDLNPHQQADWHARHDISSLPPDSGWKTFSALLDRCYNGARVLVNHDRQRDRYVKVDVVTSDSRVALDLASTGMLQVIQILAYACFYAPPLLLLDEPDAHLHADSQARLYEALKDVATQTNTRILFASHSPQLIQRLMYDSGASVVWMSEGAKVPVDEAERPAIPVLMALGALSAGAEVFDPARSVVLMTEDKITRAVKTLAIANGAPDNLAVLSYNGCGNLPAARLLANMIADMRPDVKIIIHRDRDFRTEQEMRFEILTSNAERERNGVTRVTEIFTPFNDVEHSFAQAGHLQQVFSDITPESIDQVLTEALAYQRDELRDAARTAREQIRLSLYDVPRKMSKPEWAESGMPNAAPRNQEFTPANSLEPIAFNFAHGKKLMTELRTRLHHLVGGATQAIEENIYSVTDMLSDQAWQDAFEERQPMPMPRAQIV